MFISIGSKALAELVLETENGIWCSCLGGSWRLGFRKLACFSLAWLTAPCHKHFPSLASKIKTPYIELIISEIALKGQWQGNIAHPHYKGTRAERILKEQRRAKRTHWGQTPAPVTRGVPRAVGRQVKMDTRPIYTIGWFPDNRDRSPCRTAGWSPHSRNRPWHRLLANPPSMLQSGLHTMTCSVDPNLTTDPAQKNNKICIQFCFQFPSFFFLLKVFLENKPEENWVYYSVMF